MSKDLPLCRLIVCGPDFCKKKNTSGDTPGLSPKMDAWYLYIEAIAELRSHLEMKMSSWCFFCRSHRGVGPYGPEAKAPAWSLQAQLGLGEGCETTSTWASCLYASQLGKGQHEDLVHFQKLHCHKMARIARCGVAFPLACVAHNIFGETPVVNILDWVGGK